MAGVIDHLLEEKKTIQVVASDALMTVWTQACLVKISLETKNGIDKHIENVEAQIKSTSETYEAFKKTELGSFIAKSAKRTTTVEANTGTDRR